MGRGSTARVAKVRAASGRVSRRRVSRVRGRPAVATSTHVAARASKVRARMRPGPMGRFRTARRVARDRSGRARVAAQVARSPAPPGPAVPVTAPRDRVASEADHAPAAIAPTAHAPTARGRGHRAPAASDRDRAAFGPVLVRAVSAPMRLARTRRGPTSTPEPIATVAPPRPPGVSGSRAGSGRLSRPGRPVVGSAVRGRASRRGPDLLRGPVSRPGPRPVTRARATATKRLASTARPVARWAAPVVSAARVLPARGRVVSAARDAAVLPARAPVSTTPARGRASVPARTPSSRHGRVSGSVQAGRTTPVPKT